MSEEKEGIPKKPPRKKRKTVKKIKESNKPIIQKMEMQIEMNVKLTLWSAIKLRIAGANKLNDIIRVVKKNYDGKEINNGVVEL